VVKCCSLATTAIAAMSGGVGDTQQVQISSDDDVRSTRLNTYDGGECSTFNLKLVCSRDSTPPFHYI
jgi:hypothetical protein